MFLTEVEVVTTSTNKDIGFRDEDWMIPVIRPDNLVWRLSSEPIVAKSGIKSFQRDHYSTFLF